jgi:hypothetical protein
MDERQKNLADNLHRAWPIDGQYVTRAELADELERMESRVEIKIDNSSLRQRNWVLGGCLGTILAFGSGYISLVSKLDRLTDALPTITAVQEHRGPWIQRQEQRDDRQDQALHKLAPDYSGLPYVEPPK